MPVCSLQIRCPWGIWGAVVNHSKWELIYFFFTQRLTKYLVVKCPVAKTKGCINAILNNIISIRDIFDVRKP